MKKITFLGLFIFLLTLNARAQSIVFEGKTFTGTLGSNSEYTYYCNQSGGFGHYIGKLADGRWYYLTSFQSYDTWISKRTTNAINTTQVPCNAVWESYNPHLRQGGNIPFNGNVSLSLLATTTGCYFSPTGIVITGNCKPSSVPMGPLSVADPASVLNSSSALRRSGAIIATPIITFNAYNYILESTSSSGVNTYKASYLNTQQPSENYFHKIGNYWYHSRKVTVGGQAKYQVMQRTQNTHNTLNPPCGKFWVGATTLINNNDLLTISSSLTFVTSGSNVLTFSLTGSCDQSTNP